MDQWYIPITILPGICLIVLSTSNLLIALNSEIIQLCQGKNHIEIVNRKIKQLERLSKAMILLYFSIAFLVLSGILLAFELKIAQLSLGFVSMISGIVLTLGSLILLINYASHALRIRKEQHVIAIQDKNS